MALRGRVLGIVCGLASVPLSAAAHTQEAAASRVVATVHALRAQAPIVVDGRLDDAAWSQAEPATTFRQGDPDEGQPATEKTELRVAYDDDALYVGVRLLDDDAAHIVRRLSRRDDSSDADRITVYLDPHHDHLTGVRFELSAAGVQRDAVIFNDSWDDGSWDAVWASAVAADAQGWTAEMRLPFSQLRFPAAEHLTWGINAARYIQRKNETDWLELVPKKESGLASRMAHLVGLDGIRPRRALALLPYVVSKAEFVDPGRGRNPFNDGSRYPPGAGLDAKYGLTSNLTLDATLNPDFGQVEVDPAVVNLSEFETFFEERRPFFIEGAQIFGNFGRNGANNFWGFNRAEPDIFYSRRIGRSPQGAADGDFVDRPQATTILGAAKVTGKTAGGWSLGLLEALTGREWARTETGGLRGRSEIEPFTSYFVGRAHRDVGRAGVGVLTTAVVRGRGNDALAAQLARRAYVGGVDGYLFLSKKKDWVVTGRVAGSRLEGAAPAIEGFQRAPQRYFQRPDRKTPRLDVGATTLSGWTGSINLNRNSGNFQVNSALWGTSPGFDSNDLGFSSRSDRWGGHVVATWRKTSPDKVSRRRSVSVAKWYVFNFDHERQADGLHLFANAQLRNYWSLGAALFNGWRAGNDRFTRGGPAGVTPAGRAADVWVETDSRKRASLNLETFYESTEYGGWSLGEWSRLNVRLSSSLSFSVGPTLNRNHTVAQWVGRFDDPSATSTFGRRYVFAGLEQTEVTMTTRLNWILSPRMSLQVYAQPLISAGDYGGFKELVRPRAFEFRRYGIDGGTLSLDPGAGVFSADPDAGGPALPFTFDDPDFNFKSLRLNAVYRWEWRLGSTLYVVWAQNRVSQVNPGDFALGRDASSLFKAAPDDVFLVKVSYRFGR